LLGPFRAGRAVAVSGVRGGGSIFYFGSVDGGVWKSTDAGTVWTPLFDSQPVASVGALEVAPSDPNVLYAGTGESDIRSDLASGDGVYKSSDAGRTWKNVGLRDTRQISRIVVDPHNPNTVLVAALGHAYRQNEERGVFRSADGGETWTKVLYRGPHIGAADLAMAADEPSLLFAALWEAHRPPWSTYAPIAGPGSGLYRSQDGGITWEPLTGHGLPAGPWGRAGVAVSANTHGRHVYAVIDAKDAGLYRSDDGGTNWTLVNRDPRITSRAWYFSCITVDPNDSEVIYAPNVALYRLSEGGKILNIVRGAPGGDDYHQLWIDPANSDHMVLGTDQGTTVTLNGGATWSSWYNQPTAQFYHVVTDNQFPYHVYGAQQDSGTAATASRTDHGEIDSRDWFTVSGSESGYIAPDPKDPNIFYVSGTYGTVARFDRRMMQSQNIAPSLLPGFGTEINQRKYRDPWTPVLVFSPAQPNSLYLGTQYVLRTLDGGLHWQTISPDLTGAKVEVMASKPKEQVDVENAKERGYGVVYTIAPSPLSAPTVWAGSDTGLIHLTRDGGHAWANVTPGGIAPWSKITQIEASHFKTGEAYAAVDRHRLDDRRPYLFRTRDFGKTWQPIVNGFGEHAFLNAIREDPQREGLLFAGTEFGVYVSFDDGEHWQSLQRNLPITSVRDLAVHDDDLIVATHGRSFWVLDNISPLRQVGAQIKSSEAWLYKPAQAVRTVSDRFSGTPLPPEEPQAGNPPRGAMIDYYLPTSASGAVEMEIADTHGKVIRRFSSREQAAASPKDLAIASRWLPQPAPLGESAGMHRFVWDLRYGRTGEQTTAGDEDTGLQTFVGPLVLPGTYQVKLTVNGKPCAPQALQVIMDPRSPATTAALREQFRWAQQAFEDMITARVAASEVRGLRMQLGKLKGHVNNAALTDSLTATEKQASQIQSGGEQNRESGLDAISRAFVITLNTIESADRVPPAQAIVLYQQSDRTLKSRLAEWRTLKQSRLPLLNRQLRDAGLTPLEIVRIEEEPRTELSQ
jgi:photosystem II stability/assembly factor-like uncharacterized protein/uncharacterized protein YjiS (DUF1127 family)